MNLLFLDLYKHDDIHNWSGTTRHITKMLESISGMHVDYMDDLGEIYSLIPTAVYKVIELVTNKKTMPRRTKFNIEKIGKVINAYIESHDVDAVFTTCTMLIPCIKNNVPVYLYTDAVFADMDCYYEAFSNLYGFAARSSNLYEKRALDRCTHIFFSSEWAKEGAIKHYGISKNKISVVRFGANVINSYSMDDIVNVISKKVDNKILELLFVGRDWKRKGGDIAAKTVQTLNKNGINAHLYVVGCDPDITAYEKSYITVYPFLDKKVKRDSDILSNLFQKCHFFILPTRRDCTPIVLAEAAAFGLPIITNNTGGVSSMVCDKVNGIVLPKGSDENCYVNAITSIYLNKEKYIEDCKNSYLFYNSELTWDVVKKKVEKIICI